MPDDTAKLIELKEILDSCVEQFMSAQVDFEEESGKVSVKGTNDIREALFNLFSYLNGEIIDIDSFEVQMWIAACTYRRELFYFRMREMQRQAEDLTLLLQRKPSAEKGFLPLLAEANAKREDLAYREAIESERVPASIRDWQEVHTFFYEGNTELSDIIDTLEDIWIDVKTQPV